MSAVALSAGVRSAGSRRRLLKKLTALLLGGALLGATAGMMAASGRAWEVIVFVGIFIPAVVWRRPQLGPAIILGAALLIEQFPINLLNGTVVAFPAVPITGEVPLFQGLPGSFHIEPADLLLFSVLVVYLIRSSRDGSRWWPHSHVSLAMRGLALAVIIGEGVGLSHHGQMRESFTEIRPFYYLIITYLLTSVLIRTRSAIQAMLWTITICETIKAFQTIYLFIETRSWQYHPQSLVAHEEAMLSGLFLFMTLALWIYGQRGRLRTASTAVFPIVLFALFVNERRTAWAILGVGLIVMTTISYVALPQRRQSIRRVVGVVLAISAVYFPAFWNNQGTLGQPANALRSEFGTPSARDALSDDYRVMENANLELNIRQAGILGMGFGREIDYALPMPGLVVAVDPAIMYIPHNGVLYILMRLGLFGGVVFWALIGAVIIQGCRLARHLDPQLAMLGALSAGTVAGWAVEGATDQGFVDFRAVFAIGCMIGLAEAARHIGAAEKRAVRSSRAAFLRSLLGSAEAGKSTELVRPRA